MNLPLNPSLPLVPFEKWGIDYIGQISPASSSKNEYIIIATEYLTKWAETKAVKKADAKQTAIFLYENIISRFGYPKILISDRSTHFLNPVIKEMTLLFQINHRKTTPYHSQTNGQTERVNQTLIRILRKIVTESKKNLDVKLTAAL
jgi:transposase InsO family protein